MEPPNSGHVGGCNYIVHLYTLFRERFTPWRIFISHVHTYCITYMYIYNVHTCMYICASIEAADVCLQCTRTMCNIECCRFTNVKESSVCYTYIIQEEALVKGFYLHQHSLIPRDHTHLCGKGPFLHKWVWCLGTRPSLTQVSHAHSTCMCIHCIYISS